MLPNIPNRCLDPLVSSQLLSALSQSRRAGIGSLLLPNRVQEPEERGLWPWWSSPSLCPGCMWGTTGLHRVRLSWLLPTCVVSYLEGPLPVVSRLVQNRSYMARNRECSGLSVCLAMKSCHVLVRYPFSPSNVLKAGLWQPDSHAEALWVNLFLGALLVSPSSLMFTYPHVSAWLSWETHPSTSGKTKVINTTGLLL